MTGFLFRILAGLYATVARIYDIMLSLTGYYKDGGLPDNYIITTSNVMTTMYTLAGVFMLFKVTISMINMLIEPDQINDRQAGAGKIVTRIVTSLLMLILFVPNGWIFNKDSNNPGILMRIEKALLAEDGLIHNLMPEINGQKANMQSVNKSNGIFIDNVSAVLPSDTGSTTTGYDCYYVYITRSNAAQAQKSNAGTSDVTPNSEKSITHVLHLTLYGDKDKGTSGKICPGNGKILNCDYSYNADSMSSYDTIKNDLTWAKVKDGWPTQHNCPNRIDTGSMKAYDGYGDGANTWSDVTSQYVGGWHSLSAMQEDVQASGLPAASTKASKIAKLLGIDAENSFLYGVSDEAANFARGALSSFLQCTGSSEDCDSLKEGALSSNEANNNIADALNDDNPSITLDFMIGVVAGIGLVVWIALLCVDVIIRRFKLILLEMMAPIPIIAYSDPKDETFNKWIKMYGSTYADLFIKLIAIAFAILLLQQMDAAMEDTGLLRFFYIIAILLFAKLIPSMISKIFGIDISSGTFKDIANMSKKVLGATAGAAIGGLTGGISGAIFGSAGREDLRKKVFGGAAGFLGGAFSGTAKGINSGRQGTLAGVTAGAKSVSNNSRRVAQDRLNGISRMERLLGNATTALGLPDYAEQVDLEIKGKIALREKLKEVAGIKSKVFDTASGSDFMKSVYAWRQAGHSISDDRIRSLAEAWANEEVLMYNGKGGYRNDEWIDSEKQRLNYNNMSAADKQRTDQMLKTQKNNYNASIFLNHTSEFSDIYNSTNDLGQRDFLFNFNEKIFDGGNAGALDSLVRDTSAILQGRPDIAKIVGTDHIDSITQAGKLAASAWNNDGGINSINDEIRERTVQDEKYVNSVNSRLENKEQK